ncbi:hypothetical protein UlMin_034151 [Ulmus minor]
MKIQCDVCNEDEASLFCTADEAALCDSCDHRVHHANKLASKHQRFSLMYPSSKQFPVCDICQERRAFLFCQQDRAILCRECDVPIHAANELTQKHNRFLLTGVKLSATSALYGSSSSILTNGSEFVSDPENQVSARKSVSVSPAIPNPPSVAKNSSSGATTVSKRGEDLSINDGSGLTSSISEYLIELPGWHVEDFLDSSSTPFGFSKSSDDGMFTFLDGDFQSYSDSFSSENMGIWVPQAPAPFYPSELSKIVGLKETKETTNSKAIARRRSDDAFTVPQISPQSSGFKRTRPFW